MRNILTNSTSLWSFRVGEYRYLINFFFFLKIYFSKLDLLTYFQIALCKGLHSTFFSKPQPVKGKPGRYLYSPGYKLQNGIQGFKYCFFITQWKFSWAQVVRGKWHLRKIDLKFLDLDFQWSLLIQAKNMLFSAKTK